MARTFFTVGAFVLTSAMFTYSSSGLTADECYLPIDVMFLQDSTGSFQDDLPIVQAQIPNMVEQILAQNPDSRFGLAEFKDKPIVPLGELNDYCYQLAGGLSEDVTDFQAAYQSVVASGGQDPSEAQFNALIDIAKDSNVGWREVARPTRAGQAGARLVIMSTDAQPHLPGDMEKYREDPRYSAGLPAPLAPYPGPIIADDNIYKACVNYDYPKNEYVKQALEEEQIYLAILTPTDYKNVTDTWHWFNEQFLGQPASFYQYINNNSDNLLEGVLAAIRGVTEFVCAQTTTTTIAPETTTPATTTPAPTTTTTMTTATTTMAPTTTALPPITDTTTRMTTATVTTTTPEMGSPDTTTTMTTAIATTTTPEMGSPDTTTTMTTAIATTTSEGCHNPCPPQGDCCPFRPAVVVKVSNRPKSLVIDYEQ